jgi:hypothetical protein
MLHPPRRRDEEIEAAVEAAARITTGAVDR